jgi:glucose/arabinose dehydrogenase
MDLVADNEDELSAITFGTGFEEGITDIETGPDGYLYILSFGGQLYRIVPR